VSCKCHTSPQTDNTTQMCRKCSQIRFFTQKTFFLWSDSPLPRLHPQLRGGKPPPRLHSIGSSITRLGRGLDAFGVSVPQCAPAKNSAGAHVPVKFECQVYRSKFTATWEIRGRTFSALRRPMVAAVLINSNIADAVLLLT